MASVLAVDDSTSMRQMVSFTLKGAGYDVIEAADGVEALNIAKSQSVNLVLTDVNMPNHGRHHLDQRAESVAELQVYADADAHH